MSTVPDAGGFVNLDHDEQDLLVAALKATRGLLTRSVEAEVLPQAREAKRALVEQLGRLADAVAAPRATLVMPGARKGQAEEPST